MTRNFETGYKRVKALEERKDLGDTVYFYRGHFILLSKDDPSHYNVLRRNPDIRVTGEKTIINALNQAVKKIDDIATKEDIRQKIEAEQEYLQKLEKAVVEHKHEIERLQAKL